MAIELPPYHMLKMHWSHTSQKKRLNTTMVSITTLMWLS